MRWQNRQVGCPADEVAEDRLVHVDRRLEREVAELLQPFLGTLQMPLGIREQHPVLEAEVDVLPLGADPGEVPDAAHLRQGVGDPAPARPDRLDRTVHGLEDHLAESPPDPTDGIRIAVEEEFGRELVRHVVMMGLPAAGTRQVWRGETDRRPP